MLKFATYSENLRWAMNTKENRHKRPFSIRDIAEKCDFSYEHVRKAFNGQPAFGEGASRVICDFLGLPADEMWQLAKREKMAKELGYKPIQLPDPQGQQLSGFWNSLDSKGREMLVTMAAGLVATAKEAVRPRFRNA